MLGALVDHRSSSCAAHHLHEVKEDLPPRPKIHRLGDQHSTELQEDAAQPSVACAEASGGRHDCATADGAYAKVHPESSTQTLRPGYPHRSLVEVDLHLHLRSDPFIFTFIPIILVKLDRDLLQDGNDAANGVGN